MKLLFDENISYRILPLLKDHFEQAESIFNVKSVKEDLEIWNYAKRNGFTIVTFDEDFYDWQLLKGFPPKIIWLRMGNTPTKFLAERLIAEKDQIKRLIDDSELGVLEIYYVLFLHDRTNARCYCMFHLCFTK